MRALAHVRKIEACATLAVDEKRKLEALCSGVRSFDRRRMIIDEGDDPTHVHVMLEGWAARFGLNEEGGRQITAFMLPGDFCDIHVTSLARMDHGIVAITDCKVGMIEKKSIDEITRSTPALTLAFWRSSLVDVAIARKWLVNAGRKSAYQAVAHLFCELHVRLQQIGEASEHNVHLPLTQEEIGDATGLTAVHVNRTLRKLKADGLIVVAGEGWRIPDVAALREAADFNPA